MSRLFLLNLFLAMVYVALTDDITFMNFALGFVLGIIVLSLYSRSIGAESYGGMYIRLTRFALYFLRILVVANLQVAWEIITPKFHMTPRIIRYPVKGMTPVQLTTLANAITLTPGTLTADVDDAGEYLYIHCMYARDRDATMRELDELKDRLMREVFGR